MSKIKKQEISDRIKDRLFDYFAGDKSKYELHIKGQQYVWHYKGDSLQEYINFANLVMSYGGTFFEVANRRPSGSHITYLDYQMAMLVLAFYHELVDGNNTHRYPDGFPFLDKRQARGFTTNYNYLVHFGLFGKMNIGKHVYYYLTSLGKEFAEGTQKCCEYVVGSKSDVLSRSSTTIGIGDLLSDWDKIDHKWWVK